MKPRLFIAAVLLMAGVLDFSAILAMLTFDGRDRDALLERYYLASSMFICAELEAATPVNCTRDATNLLNRMEELHASVCKELVSHCD